NVSPAPERTSREPRTASLPHDEAQLRGTLQSLSPQARAVAVLRHHDGLTPGQICERLGMTVDVVRERLQEVSAAVRTWLGLETADQSFNVDGMSAAEVTVADHAWRS
ncbi:MAG: sigma factor-like helix-turn-helix DNA-binding protein, partial [Demequina sp.]